MLFVYLCDFKANQHKAACRKTRLDIQNDCNGNLFCDHGVVERNRISSLAGHGKALEKNVSRVSSVIVVIRLPISCLSSMAISCHVLAVSMAAGRRCVCWPIWSICLSSSALSFGLLHLVCYAANVGLSIRVWYCHVPDHWLSSGPWQESGPIWEFVVVPHQAGWLFNCWYLRWLDRARHLCDYMIFVGASAAYTKQRQTEGKDVLLLVTIASSGVTMGWLLRPVTGGPLVVGGPRQF